MRRIDSKINAFFDISMANVSNDLDESYVNMDDFVSQHNTLYSYERSITGFK